MAKPTREELLACTSRGGRVFLFDYPSANPDDPYAGCHMPTYEAQQKIEDALLNFLGCTSIEGPLINGIVAITFDQEADRYTDDQLREKIAGIFYRYWRE